VRLSYTCTQNGQSYTVVQYILAGDSDYNITYSATGDSSELSSLAESSINTFRELDPDNDPSLLVNRLATRDYRDGAKGYSLTLPKNWRVASQTSDTVVFTDVDETYSINVQCSEADSSLFRYQQSYFDDYFTAAFGQTATISQFQTTTLSDTKALYLVCSYTYHGTALTSKQYIVNSDDTAYHITFTAPTASASKIDFAAVAKSFRLP
jgi:hypothetical protein